MAYNLLKRFESQRLRLHMERKLFAETWRIRVIELRPCQEQDMQANKSNGNV